MHDPPGRSTRRLLEHLIPALFTGAFLLLRARLAPRGLDELGLVAIRDAGITLAFWGLLILLAWAVGEAILAKLQPPGLSRLESGLFGFGLGMGMISLCLTGLGLIGILSRTWISVLLVGTSAAAGPRVVDILKTARTAGDSLRACRHSASPLARGAAVLAGAIGVLAVAQALTPPWDYDGLMYHLVGPRMFLQAGRIFPFTDNWYINGPFSIEMLFSIGLAFGDDVLPKLLHLGFGFVLVGATYAAARRWLPEGKAWLAPAILLTVPTLPIFSAFAYIDLGWSAYEFLALLAVVLWGESRSDRLLLLSGLMIGWAMGSKYLGLEGFALLGLLVLIMSLKDGLPAVARRSLVIGLPAAAIAMPWYLKNAIWFGNPVFPLYFGGPGWDSNRLGLYSAFLDSFGVGRAFLDYVLLPVNIYVRHVSFGAVMNRIDIPSVLFPLAVAYPLTRRARPLSILLIVATGRFIVWAAGSQQTRYLLPIYPVLALVTAHVIIRVTSRFRRATVLSLLGPPLTAGLLTITLLYQSLLLLQTSAFGTTAGTMTRRAFLEGNVTGFHAFDSPVLTEADGRILLLGDGRGYYCSPGCIPDPDHFRWAADLGQLGTCEAVRDWMETLHARAIMLNLQDLDFLLQHDPTGVMSAAVRRVLRLNDAGCFQQIYQDDSIRVFTLAQ